MLDGLISSTNAHFAAEERLLKRHGYPESDRHHAIHITMVDKVKDIQRQHSEGRLNLSLDTMKFLNDWITKPIMKTDKRHRSYLKSNGVS